MKPSTMSRLVGALLCCATVQAIAADPGVCESWAQNAMIGAQRAMQGKLRKLMPFTQPQINQMISHGTFGQIAGIAVLADELSSPEGRAFLEESIFYGFDYMQQVPAAERRQRLDGNLQSVFLRACPRASGDE